MLRVEHLDVYYGRLQVLWGVSLDVGREGVGLFGPNGAGKTTLISAIVGLVRPASGQAYFDGRPLGTLPPHLRVRMGIAVVTQERDLFPMMSVLENLKAGASYVPHAREHEKEGLEIVYTLFPVLKDRWRQPAGTLSGGQQRMLAIGRALMSRPKLLILDEPSCGLQPSLVRDLFARLREIKEGGMAVFIAEQNVRQCLKAVDRGYVLENGRVVMEGSSQALSENDHVRMSYMGLT